MMGAAQQKIFNYVGRVEAEKVCGNNAKDPKTSCSNWNALGHLSQKIENLGHKGVIIIRHIGQTRQACCLQYIL